MVMNFLDPRFGQSLNQKFREKRFRFFTGLVERVQLGRPLRILDIGGTESYWERMGYLSRSDAQITLLNLGETMTGSSNVKSVQGDACDLSRYRDGEFDVVFSNSVIEHLFSKENQRMMACEAMRVGRHYFIQTPNRYFPIEPHWMFPCFQFLPFRVRVLLTSQLSLGHFKKASSRDAAVRRVNEVRLLNEMEMKSLFPDGKVYRELFLGLTKSITMYRFPEGRQ